MPNDCDVLGRQQHRAADCRFDSNSTVERCTHHDKTYNGLSIVSPGEILQLETGFPLNHCTWIERVPGGSKHVFNCSLRAAGDE